MDSMNKEIQDSDAKMTRQRAAAEVIELGEMLFDAALEAAARQEMGGEEGEAGLVGEMRAAADEFFVALRLLLETGQTGQGVGERTL